MPKDLAPIDPIPIEEWIDASDAARELITIVQDRRRLCDAYQSLLRTDEPRGFLHGDLKLDNVLLGKDGPRLIDWELSGYGPTNYDLASIVAALLDTWVRSIRASPNTNLTDWAAMAGVPLSVVSTTIRVLLTAYAGSLKRPGLDLPTFERVVGSVSGCLVLRAWTSAGFENELGVINRLRLLIAEALVERPNAVFADLAW